MRQFIRHPSDIPIALSFADRRALGTEHLKDIGEGGLCFRTHGQVESGRAVRVTISIRKPPFEADGVVVWCRRTNEHFDVGVSFENTSTDFAVRMVEQVCHVEHYKREVLHREGRRLSGDEAAAEWIAKFAGEFPH